MTLEEAGEVILGGSRAWLRCDACNGMGRVTDDVVPIESHACGKCMRSGSIRNPTYELAHSLINPSMSYPARPLSPREKVVQMGAELVKDGLSGSTEDRLKAIFPSLKLGPYLLRIPK